MREVKESYLESFANARYNDSCKQWKIYIMSPPIPSCVEADYQMGLWQINILYTKVYLDHPCFLVAFVSEVSLALYSFKENNILMTPVLWLYFTGVKDPWFI